jgi:hypothetical protein
MSASHLCPSDLYSAVLSDGAVILGEGTDARERSLTERYILQRLRSGESLGMVVQSLMVLEQADLESARHAVDEFASSLLKRRSNPPEIVPAGVAHLLFGHVDELVVKQDTTFTGLVIGKESLPDLPYGG